MRTSIKGIPAAMAAARQHVPAAPAHVAGNRRAAQATMRAEQQ